MRIHHGIIPAAGLGTRFLPVTKVVPKELLPLLRTPAIEYIVQEAIETGITDCSIITSSDKSALTKYFESMPELEELLMQKKSEHLLASLGAIRDTLRLHTIIQDRPLGLGHAVLQARQVVGDQYFGVLLPDDIIMHTEPALKQLADIARTYQVSVIAVQEVAPEHVPNYGIIAIKQEIAPGIMELSGLVEKPSAAEAPSRFGIIGRYILSPRIFDSLAVIERGAGNEIQLTDGINRMVRQHDERVFACIIKGTRYDIGVPLGWLCANIDLGLQIPEYASAITRVFQNRIHN